MKKMTFVTDFCYSQLIPRADTYAQPSDVELSVNEVLKIVSYVRLQRVLSTHV